MPKVLRLLTFKCIRSDIGVKSPENMQPKVGRIFWNFKLDSLKCWPYRKPMKTVYWQNCIFTLTHFAVHIRCVSSANGAQIQFKSLLKKKPEEICTADWFHLKVGLKIFWPKKSVFREDLLPLRLVSLRGATQEAAISRHILWLFLCYI